MPLTEIRRQRRVTGVSVAAVAVSVLTCTRVHAAGAGEGDAAPLFDEAASAYKRGDFRAAALAFEEAYRRAPRGATMYDAAVAWEQAKIYDRAADDFDAALLEPTLDAKHAAAARQQLAATEARTARVTFEAPADARITVGTHEAFRAPFRLHLLPGTYTARIHYASGADAARDLAVHAGESVTQSFAPDPTPPSTPAPPPAIAAPPAASVSSPSSSSLLAVLGWSALGVGVASAATSAILWGQTVHTRNEFDAGGDVDATLHDRASALRAATNVTLVSGIVVGAAGVVALVLSRTGSHERTSAAR